MKAFYVMLVTIVLLVVGLSVSMALILIDEEKHARSNDACMTNEFRVENNEGIYCLRDARLLRKK